MLLVSPSPNAAHQRASGRLYRVLVSACPDDLEVVYAPLDWQPDRRNSFEPDLLVVAREGGIGSYWIVDPAVPSIVAYDLVDGAYLEIARAEGDQQVALAHRYPVELTPSTLVES